MVQATAEATRTGFSDLLGRLGCGVGARHSQGRAGAGVAGGQQVAPTRGRLQAGKLSGKAGCAWRGFDGGDEWTRDGGC